MIRVLVHPRAGSLYATRVLQEAGLNVGHEYTEADGTVSGFAYGTPPYPLFPWEPPKGRLAHVGENIEQMDWTATIHQVRDPLKTISSAYVVVGSVSWVFYERTLGIPKRAKKLYRCMMLWVKLNELFQSMSLFTYQLEKIKEEWPRIQEATGIVAPFPEAVPTDTNHNKRNQIPYADKNFKVESIKELWEIDPSLSRKIERMARDYGYNY